MDNKIIKYRGKESKPTVAKPKPKARAEMVYLDPKRMENAVIAHERSCLINLVAPEYVRSRVSSAPLGLMNILRSNPMIYKQYLKEIEMFEYMFKPASFLRRPSWKHWIPTVENFTAHKKLIENKSIAWKYTDNDMAFKFVCDILASGMLPTNEEYEIGLKDEISNKGKSGVAVDNILKNLYKLRKYYAIVQTDKEYEKLNTLENPGSHAVLRFGMQSAEIAQKIIKQDKKLVAKKNLYIVEYQGGKLIKDEPAPLGVKLDYVAKLTIGAKGAPKFIMKNGKSEDAINEEAIQSYYTVIAALEKPEKIEASYVKDEYSVMLYGIPTLDIAKEQMEEIRELEEIDTNHLHIAEYKGITTDPNDSPSPVGAKLNYIDLGLEIN